jgi:hypothetical protein
MLWYAHVGVDVMKLFVLLFWNKSNLIVSNNQ